MNEIKWNKPVPIKRKKTDKLKHNALVSILPAIYKTMMLQFKYILIALEIGTISCNESGSKGSMISATPLDSIIYKNYVYAVENEGTFQYFLVIKVKDLNTNQTKEICTNGNFLDGAIHMEYKIDYDSLGMSKIENLQKLNKDRYFEFKDTAALNNIGINNYSMDELANFERTHNIDSLAQIVKKGKWSLWIPDNKMMLLYAHSLFNRGILTGENNCFGGTLEHVEESWIIEEKNFHDRVKRVINLMKKDKS